MQLNFKVHWQHKGMCGALHFQMQPLEFSRDIFHFQFSNGMNNNYGSFYWEQLPSSNTLHLKSKNTRICCNWCLGNAEPPNVQFGLNIRKQPFELCQHLRICDCVSLLALQVYAVITQRGCYHYVLLFREPTMSVGYLAIELQLVFASINKCKRTHMPTLLLSPLPRSRELCKVSPCPKILQSRVVTIPFYKVSTAENHLWEAQTWLTKIDPCSFGGVCWGLRKGNEIPSSASKQIPASINGDEKL